MVTACAAVAALVWFADLFLVSHHEKAANATCGNVYVALNGEIANELDGALNGGTGRCRATDAAEVVDCVLREHAGEDNPLDKHQRAYVWGNPAPCQVALTPSSARSVMFSQTPRIGAPLRTFSIRVD
jgi:hypothetical protein